MRLSGYVAVARRWWWTLIAAVWVAGLSGYLVAERLPETYQAEAKLLVGSATSVSENEERAARGATQLYAGAVTLRDVLQRVIDNLGLQTTPEALREAVTARPDPVTRLLTIQVQYGDPQVAADIANGLVPAVRDVLAERLPTRPVTLPETEVIPVEEAVAPVRPVAPQVPLIVVLAAGAGLVGALLLIVLIEFFSDTIKSRYELIELGEAPFLGAVRHSGRFRPSPVQPLITDALPESRTAVSYRLVAGKIAVSENNEPLRVLLVVGLQGGDGAGEFAANLAAVIARSGRRAAIVDANDVEGEVTRLFGAADRPGLTELLETRQGRESSVERVRLKRAPGLDVVPRGAAASELVDLDSARDMLRALLMHVDVVVLNAAPVHRSGSTLIWARLADGTVLIAQQDQSKRENLTHAVDSLRLVGARLIGTVLFERRHSILERRQARVSRPPSAGSAGAGGRPPRGGGSRDDGDGYVPSSFPEPVSPRARLGDREKVPAGSQWEETPGGSGRVERVRPTKGRVTDDDDTTP